MVGRSAFICASTACRNLPCGNKVFLLLLILTFPISLLAQTVQASYPLLVDLVDSTGNYGDVQLLGNPTPPAPPSNGVCANGIYFNSPDGQDIRTPNITTFDQTDFQIEVEFNLTALPAVSFPVLMGGPGYRWIGIYVDSSGTMGVKHNNSNYIWSSTTVIPGTWYSALLKFDTDTVHLILNGTLVLDATVGSLNTNNEYLFLTNDFANGRALNGCIRNLNIYNDTTLPVELLHIEIE